MQASLLAILFIGLFAAVWSMPSKHSHDGYFQYINVPGHKKYEFGWNRGNPHHFVSRFEQGKDHRFRTRVKWGDTHDGYGEHYWEYNHGPKHGYHHDDKHKGNHGYKGHHSENIPVVVPVDGPSSPLN